LFSFSLLPIPIPAVYTRQSMSYATCSCTLRMSSAIR
jgi:hypothetical protein